MTKFIEIPRSKEKIARRKLICGVGINDASYAIFNSAQNSSCPYYKVWYRMIRRCYYKPKDIYRGCCVNPNWLLFSNFKLWMESRSWEFKYLDKDIIKLNNKEYGPNTCCFVSAKVNSLFPKSFKQTKLPIGTDLNLRTNKYRAHCSDNKSNQIFLGYFESMQEASKAYIKAKAIVLAFEFKGITDTRIKNGLYNLLKETERLNNKIIQKYK